MKRTFGGCFLGLVAAVAMTAGRDSYGQVIYTADQTGAIRAYNSVTGSPTLTITTGVSAPESILLSGNAVYSGNRSTVTKYDATTGALLLTMTGVTEPVAMDISGNQLLVLSEDNGSDTSHSLVSEFNATTGALDYSVPVASGGADLLIAGNSFYVASEGGGSVAQYDLATGAAGFSLSDATNGINGPKALAILGNTLYVGNDFSSTVKEFDATTGQAGLTITTGVSKPISLGIANGELYLDNRGNNTITEYDALTGSLGFTVSTGTNVQATDMAVSGGKVYTTAIPYFDSNNGQIREFDAATGAPILTITGSGSVPLGLAVNAPVPEPGSWEAAAAGMARLYVAGRWMKVKE